jgi:hypothetical protein
MEMQVFAAFVQAWNTRTFLTRSTEFGSLDFAGNCATSPSGIRVALQLCIMRKIAIVIVVASLFASTAAISVKHQRRWTEKLDVALVPSAQQATGDPVQLLIQVRPESTDRIMSHLAQHGLKAERASAAGVVTVQMPASMLRSIAGDPDVVHLSKM